MRVQEIRFVTSINLEVVLYNPPFPIFKMAILRNQQEYEMVR